MAFLLQFSVPFFFFFFFELREMLACLAEDPAEIEILKQKLQNKIFTLAKPFHVCPHPKGLGNEGVGRGGWPSAGLATQPSMLP